MRKDKKQSWYRVVAEDNYYDDMVGELVRETPRTMILEFVLLGDIQKVQFYREQLVYDGEY